MPRTPYQVSALGKRKRSSTKRPSKRRRLAYSGKSTRTVNPQSMVVHRGIGLPDKLRTKLMYCESIALGNFTSSILQYKAFNLSQPYDPDPAIGGGQPTYYDQLSAIYNEVNVVGAKMTVTFVKTDNSGITSDGPYMVGVIGGVSSTPATTDAPTLCTTANSQWDILHTQATKNCVATYSPRMLSANGTNESSTLGTSAAYYGIVWASPQGTAVTGVVNAIVSIEYICDFFSLNQVIDY